MKISTKGRYGMRIMLELALNTDLNFVTVKHIAEKQEISEKYIEQIISIINKSGLVRSQRGALGGYKLAAPANTITLGQILRATEGELEIVKCIADNPQACKRRDECVTADVWLEVKRAMEAVVDNITLADLVDRYHEKCSFVYMI